MDPAEIKRKYGDRTTPYGDKITLHSTLNIQNTLPLGTIDDVRNEVITRIKTCGYDGGLFLGPSNIVPMETPVKNIWALYDTARTFDLKSLQP